MSARYRRGPSPPWRCAPSPWRPGPSPAVAALWGASPARRLLTLHTCSGTGTKICGGQERKNKRRVGFWAHPHKAQLFQFFNAPVYKVADVCSETPRGPFLARRRHGRMGCIPTHWGVWPLKT